MPNKTFTQFRVDNVTETLPTTLAYGQEVYYKDSTGALTLYVGDESGVAQPVVGSGYPSRVVNVFGTANNVAPNFTTVSGALTYANSLTPIVTEPVVIRLFAKADGTPYDLTGLSSWTTYANQYIYFESDFVRLNETTTLPTTLPAGKEVWYIDSNGVETLWIGREDGSAWPAVGYKEYVALLSQTGTNAPTATVRLNTMGTVSYERTEAGFYVATHPSGAIPYPYPVQYIITSPSFFDDYAIYVDTASSTTTQIRTFEGGVLTDAVMGVFYFTLRIYP